MLQGTRWSEPQSLQAVREESEAGEERSWSGLRVHTRPNFHTFAAKVKVC